MVVGASSSAADGGEMGLAAGSSSADDGGAYFSGGSITVSSRNGANAVGGPVTIDHGVGTSNKLYSISFDACITTLIPRCSCLSFWKIDRWTWSTLSSCLCIQIKSRELLASSPLALLFEVCYISREKLRSDETAGNNLQK